MTTPTASLRTRAAAFHRFGGPEVLELLDLPRPTAGPGEVVVRVAAATVNPTDLLMLTGQQATLMQNLVPPYVAGMEFAGHVHAMSPDAPHLQVGQPVMGVVNPRRPAGGAQSEYIALPAASVVAVPPSVDLAEAATVPMNGLTAWMALQALALPRGATLLVTGGAGAVGGYVIQLARHTGLQVLADGKDSDAALLRDLGAAQVVPRGDGMAPAVRALHPQGVDGLVDTALLGDPAAALVRAGGSVVSLRRSARITQPGIRHSYVGVLDEAGNTAALRELAEHLRNGALTPRIAARVPMAQAAEAFRKVQAGGLRGRVVIEFGGPQ